MKRFGVMLIGLLNFTLLASAADLSTAPSQDLLALYKPLRAIQGGGQAAPR